MLPKLRMVPCCSRESPERLLLAMAGLERLAKEASSLRQRLDGNYDLRVLKANLVELQKEWAAAAASNFLVRNGRKEKVRLRLKPYCDDVPGDISSDLAVLKNLADLASKAEEYGGVLGDCASGTGSTPTCPSFLRCANGRRRASST